MESTPHTTTAALNPHNRGAEGFSESRGPGIDEPIHLTNIGTTAILHFNPEIKSLDNSVQGAHPLLKSILGIFERLEAGTERVVISLRGIDYLGAQPLSIFLGLHLGAQNGRSLPIALSDLGEKPREKLHTTRLDALIPHFDTAAAAVEAPSWKRSR